MGVLTELHNLEQEYQAVLALPVSPTKIRQLKSIAQRREELWAKRRRELAGHTNGRGRLEELAATVPDLDESEVPLEDIPKDERRSEAMRRYWVQRRAKQAEVMD